MKATKILKATVFSALLLAGTSGAAFAQELVSGLPYEGYLKGVLIPADGPRVVNVVGRGEGNPPLRVESRTIRIGELGSAEFARINAEALIGLPVETGAEVTTIATAK